MKRFYKFLMPLVAIAALAMPWPAHSQGTLTVANGNATNTFVPVYGYYADAYQHSQVVYPASMVSDLQQYYITSISWYMGQVATSSIGATIEIRMGVVADSTLTDFLPTSSMQLVWSGTVNGTNAIETFVFDSAFYYSDSALVVDVQLTQTGSYYNTSYVGVQRANASVHSYDYGGVPTSGGTQYGFLPKTTFSYNTTSDICHTVNALTVGVVTDESISVSWSANGSSNFSVSIDGVNWTDVSDTSYTFSGLNGNEPYTVYVRSVCGYEDTSVAATVQTRTNCSSQGNTLPYEDNFANYALQSIPFCWTVLQSYTDYGIVYPQVGNTYDYTTYSAMKVLLFSPGYGEPNLIALPRMDAPANELNFSVTAYVDPSNPSSIEVGYVTSLAANATFTALGTITGTVAAEYEYNTAAVTADSIWLAIRCTTTSSYAEAYVTHVRVSHRTDCQRPTGVTLDTVGHDMAEMHWNGTGADGYAIALSTTSSIGDAIIIDADDTTYSFSGLNTSTHYYTWVASVCSGDTSEWRVGPEFTTACGADFCTSTVTLTDAYAGIVFVYGGIGADVYVDGSIVASLGGTTATGPVSTATVAVCSDTPLSLVLSGSDLYSDYFEYISYTITDGSGAQVASGTASGHFSGDTLYRLNNPCPTCEMPTAIATDIDLITSSSVTVHWTPANASDNTFAISVDGAYVGTVTNDTVYTVNNLNSNTGVTIGVATICGGDDTSTYLTVTTGTMCSDVSCGVEILMADSYGDGWNGGSLQISQNGNPKGSVSLDNGNSGTASVTVCEGDALQLYWHQGSYDSEVSFVVRDLNGDTLTNSNTLTIAEGLIAVTDTVSCPGCTSPAYITTTAITDSSVTISWPAGNYSSWLVTVSDGISTAFSTITSATSVNVSGLTGATSYTAAVRSICAAGDTSVAIIATFTTACSAITLPWTDNLTTYGYYGVMPYCWHTVKQYYSYGYYYPMIESDGMFFYVENVDSCMAATPVIPAAGNNLYVRFHAMGEDGVMTAGIITDVNNPSTFIPLVTITSDEMAEYEFFTDGLTITGNVHVAFKLKCTANGSYGNMLVQDVYVQEIPSCQRPDSVAVSVTSNSAVLTWPATPAGNYIFYFNGTAIDTLTATTKTLTGLTPGTNYTASVQSLCGSDLSLATTVNFATQCGALTLPYSEDFDSYTEYIMPNCWTVKNQFPDYSSNLTPSVYSYAYYAHSGSKLMRIIGTATNQTTAITPALSGAGVDSLWVSFWLSGNSSSGVIAGIMTDPAVDSTFIPMLTVYAAGNPVQHGFRTDTIGISASEYHVAFRFITSGNSNNTIYIDDIEVVRMPDCSESIDNIEVTSTTSNDVTLQWEAGLGLNVGSTYTVNTMTDQNVPVTSLTVTGSQATVTGLTPYTSYHVSVSLTCDGSVTATSDTIAFLTRCVNSTTLEITDSTSVAGSYVPAYPYYNHSTSQQLYTSDLLGGNPLSFTSLAIHCSTSNDPLTGFHASIYMMAVPASRDTLMNWMPLDSMQLVYSGNFNVRDGWNEFLFDTPFDYDGLSNVIVCFNVDTTFGNYQSGYYFYRHDATNTTLYYFNDNNPWNIATTPYSNDYRSDMRFYGCSSACGAPEVTGVVSGENTLTVSYASDADTVEMKLCTGAFNESAPSVFATGGSYTFTGLTHSTSYILAIRSLCTTELVSAWVLDSVGTVVVNCGVPTDLQVTGTTYTTVSVSWTPAGDESAWSVRVYNTAYDQTYTATTPSYTIPDLVYTEGVYYNVSVRVLCGQNADIEGDWSAPITVHPDACLHVTGISITDITAHSVVVSWNPAENTTGYTVQWGPGNWSSLSDAETATTTATSYTINNLEANTAYSLFVINNCTQTISSTYNERILFTTAEGGEGIADVENGSFTLAPNPASTSVTLSLSGFEGAVNVEVVDMNGRVSGNWTVTDGQLTIDLNGYAQGAYFVRVTGEQQTAIRKLIVR